MITVQPNAVAPAMEEFEDEDDVKEDTKTQRKLRDVFIELGKSSSLHGIPRIFASRHILIRLMWILTLTAALVCCTLQLIGLAQEYYSYPIQTSISHGYSQLSLPALTFCNMNPIKLTSELERGMPLLRGIDTEINYVNNNFGDILYTQMTDLNERFNVSDYQDVYELYKNGAILALKWMNVTDRISYGHQAEDFIHKASFAGSAISPSAFKLYSTTTYGNCFTLDDTTVFTAYGSGQHNGLKLVFNVEPTEYMTVFGSSFGIRMVLHEQGTYPIPGKDGITFGTGIETNVGIRLTKFSRLGGKYGDCTDGREFFNSYQLQYTVQLCHIFCEDEYMFNTCGCYPLTAFGHNASVCNAYNPVDVVCMKNVYSKVQNGLMKCDCKERCKENVYTSTFSGSPWPHTSYLQGALIKDACLRNASGFRTICDDLANATLLNDAIRVSELVEPFRNYFVSVNIFFEDLNYEIFAEEAEYPVLRFLSDIGGALSLYTGASILTYVELFHLVAEVLLHIKLLKRDN